MVKIEELEGDGCARRSLQFTTSAQLQIQIANREGNGTFSLILDWVWIKLKPSEWKPSVRCVWLNATWLLICGPQFSRLIKAIIMCPFKLSRWKSRRQIDQRIRPRLDENLTEHRVYHGKCAAFTQALVNPILACILGIARDSSSSSAVSRCGTRIRKEKKDHVSAPGAHDIGNIFRTFYRHTGHLPSVPTWSRRVKKVHKSRAMCVPFFSLALIIENKYGTITISITFPRSYIFFRGNLYLERESQVWPHFEALKNWNYFLIKIVGIDRKIKVYKYQSKIVS